MKSLILKDYESFAEIPEGYLMLKEKSNLMYVRIGQSAFLAREFIDSIETYNENTTYILSYYNVKNNQKVLTLKIIKNLLTDELLYSNKREDIDIIPLSNLLNVKDNDRRFISFEDIDGVTDYKEDFIPGKKLSII